MKKTQFIELLHVIRRSWVSFFSIVMFVMLGVGVFLGLSWAGNGLLQGVQNDFDTYKFHDFEIRFAYGISQDDIDALRHLEGIAEVEGGYAAYASFFKDGEGHNASVFSASAEIDRMHVLEGSEPVAANEAAIDSLFAQKHGVQVGDTIEFSTVSTNPVTGDELLAGRAYTVTAIVEHPAFTVASINTRGMSSLSTGVCDCFVILPPSAFDASAYGDCYSNVHVRSSELDGLWSFGDAYETKAQALRSAIVALGQTNGHARYQSLVDAAQAKIDEGQRQVDEGEAQIAAAEAEIAAGEARIAQGQAQVTYGEAQVAEGERQLAAAYNELSGYQAQLDAATVEVDAQFDDAADQLIEGGVEGTHDEVKAQVREMADEMARSGKSADEIARENEVDEELMDEYGAQASESLEEYRDYLDKKQKLDDGWNAYYAKRNELDQKKAELEQGKVQLAAARQQVDAAKAQLEDARAQLDEGRQQLQQARDQMAQMVEYGWVVTGRAQNSGVIGDLAYKQSTDRLCVSMALVFIVVGLLVCYSAVSRLVREQVTSIGTKKALGLRMREITMAFLLYAIVAVVIGIVLAVATAFVIQVIMISSVSPRFDITQIPLYGTVSDVAFIGIIELAFITLTAWFACRTMLKRRAVDLLRGNEPPSSKTRFYEKWGVWNRMSLFSQSIVNNFFNDKARVIGTLIGVAGCTALVVIAVTLYDNVTKTFDLQFQDVYSFDAHITYDPDVQSADDELLAVVEQHGATGADVFKGTYALIEPSGDYGVVTVYVPEDAEAFSRLYHLCDVAGGTGVLDDSGVWIDEAYADHQGAKVGDTIEILDTMGNTRQLPIAGIMEFHLNHHELVMSKGLYEQTFGAGLTANTMLVSFDGCDESALVSDLHQTPGFFAYGNDFQLNQESFLLLKSLIVTVVYIYLALSALMALVVLMNLAVMFIEEKKRELIVLRINGFSSRAVKAYIYRDSIVLTILGIVIGVVVGMVFGYASLVSIEFDTSLYVHAPSLLACIAGAVVSAVLALVVNLVALHRIPRFNLSDINRI